MAANDHLYLQYLNCLRFQSNIFLEHLFDVNSSYSFENWISTKPLLVSVIVYIISVIGKSIKWIVNLVLFWDINFLAEKILLVLCRQLFFTYQLPSAWSPQQYRVCSWWCREWQLHHVPKTRSGRQTEQLQVLLV